jgi:hypothetical protein
VAVARQSKPPAKKLPKQRKRREHVDAKAKPKPPGVGVTMNDSFGQWRRCPKCDGDLAAVLGQGRRDSDECHRPRSEVIAFRQCAVEGWRDNPLWELDLSGPTQKLIPDSIENIGQFNDWLADESMGEQKPKELFDALAEFKSRLERVYDQANDSRRRKARARKDAETVAKAVAP